MTGVDFVGKGTFATANATSVAVPVPQHWKAGDLALLHFQQLTNNSAITTPAGWTLVVRTERTTSHVAAVYYRILQTNDAGVGNDGDAFNVTVTVGTIGRIQGVVQMHRNVDPTTPLDVAATAVTGTVPGFPSPPSDAFFQATLAAQPVSEVTRHVAFACIDVNDVVYPTNRTPLIGELFIPEHLSDMDDPGVTPLYPLRTDLVELNAYQDPSGPGAMASAYLDVPNRRPDAVPFTFGAFDSGYIAQVVALRAADQASTPEVTTSLNLFAESAGTYQLRGLLAQPPMRSHGVLLAPLGRIPGNPKLAVQVASPVRQDGGLQPLYDVAICDEAWCAGETWVDVTERVRSLKWNQGAEAGDRDRTGVLTLTLDSLDGHTSPFATEGPFVLGEGEPGAESWLVAGRSLRVVITTEAIGAMSWHSLFAGTIETMVEEYEDEADAWTTVTVVEITAALELEAKAQGEIGANEDLYTRAVRILWANPGVRWPFGLDGTLWDGATGVPGAIGATLQATTLAQSPLTELYLAGDSDATRILSDGRAAIRLAPSSPASLTPRYTFTNDAPGPGELPIADAVPYAGNERILNKAIAARAGSTQQEAVEPVSIGRFGAIASGYGFPRNDLICETDEQVLRLVRRAVAQHANDDLGIESVALDADMKPAQLFPALIDIAATALVERWVVRVDWRHPTAGTDFTFLAVIVGMTHGITMEGRQAKWVASLQLAKAVVA